MWAPGLPHAIAVKMPATTARPHPVVITIHPAPSPFDFFSKTLATTPSPSRISTMVPMNSPNIGPCISSVSLRLISGDYKFLLFDLGTFFLPVEGSGDGLLPQLVHGRTFGVVHVRLPSLIDCPVGTEVVEVLVEANRQAGCICSTQCSGFLDDRFYNGFVEDVRLELHKQVVVDHPTVSAQNVKLNA